MDEVVNYMEVWVKEILPDVFNKSDICHCDKCLRDVYAITMNHLKPYYIGTVTDRLIVKTAAMREQMQADIILAISKAIDIVKNAPRHDERV